MDHKPRFTPSILAVFIAVLLVLVILLAFFFQSSYGQKNETIVLPDPPAAPSVQDAAEEPPADDFVQVSTDNVLSVLEHMSRPSSYHQVYTVTVGADETQAAHVVELWVNGPLVRAEISNGIQTKTLLTDGSMAYLWYEGDLQPLSLTLDESVSMEDLLGLQSYDYLLSIEPEQIQDADFVVLDDPEQIQCIYVCSQDAAYVTSRYWVDLETGLLYKADILELSKQVYALRQDLFELLAEEDEAFSDRFCLPDGEMPFVKETETPQP